MTTETAQVVRFSVHLPPRGLRTNSKTRKTGWRAVLTRKYQEDVWCAGRNPGFVAGNNLGMPWEKAKLTLVWKAASVLPDADNALSSLKALIDVLKSTGPRPLGIFRDDSPDCLDVVIRCVKVAKRTMEGVDVLVERL